MGFIIGSRKDIKSSWYRFGGWSSSLSLYGRSVCHLKRDNWISRNRFFLSISISDKKKEPSKIFNVLY